MSPSAPPFPPPTAGEVVLQVSLAPVDFPHARHILPHQIRCWREQVDRILLTVDTRPGSGRYAEGWARHERDFGALLAAVTAGDPKVGVVEVDYSPQASAALSAAFLGGADVPVKDSYGAPFHAYLFGLLAAGAQYVLHADADMLYGGGSPTWMREALEVLRTREDALVAGPYPGPPLQDGRIPGAVAARHAAAQRYGSAPTALALGFPAAQFSHLSTRSFLIDLHRFRATVGALRVEATSPPRFSTVSPGPAPLETALSRALTEHHLTRVDLLGSGPGMWVLHPPFRTEAFLRDLPAIIARVEAGDVPDGQRGDFDLNDAMVDWSAARRRLRRTRRRERASRLLRAVLARGRGSP
jgi:hypothetical protein